MFFTLNMSTEYTCFMFRDICSYGAHIGKSL